MADISTEIAAFKNAVYGEDVRDAMVSLANKLNAVVSSSDLGKILAQQIYFIVTSSKFYTKNLILDGDTYKSLLIRWTGDIAHRNIESHGYITSNINNLSVNGMLNYVGTNYRYEDEYGLIWIRIPHTSVLVYDGVGKTFSIVSRNIVDGIRYIPMIGNNDGIIIHGFYSSLLFTNLLQNNPGTNYNLLLKQQAYPTYGRAEISFSSMSSGVQDQDILLVRFESLAFRTSAIITGDMNYTTNKQIDSSDFNNIWLYIDPTEFRYVDNNSKAWLKIPDGSSLVFDNIQAKPIIIRRENIDPANQVALIHSINGYCVGGLLAYWNNWSNIKKLNSDVVSLTQNINIDRLSMQTLKEIIAINVSQDIELVKGGLGSAGENYNPYVSPGWFESLRTTDYIDIHNSIIWVNPDVNISYICLYDANKQGIVRIGQRSNDDTGYFTKNIIDYAYLSELTTTSQLNNAAYIRIEVTKTGLYERVTFTNLVKILNTNTPENDNGLYSLEKEECEVLNYQRTSAEAYSKSPLAFLWISDVHNEQQRANNAFNLIKTWGSDLFDLCINTGDTTAVTQVTNLDWYNTLTANSIVPTLNVVGNHDAWVPNQNGTLAPRLDTYNYITANVKTTVPSIVQPTNAATSGFNYYYYDKGDVRIIVLDQMYWDTDQKTWFTDVLNNSSDKLVICCMHSSFSASVCDIVDCNMSKSFAIPSYLPAPAEPAECVKTFIDNGGTFVCWLVGHSHGDGLMKTKSEYGNQFIIAAPSLAQRASTLQKSNVSTSKLYNCFTYVALDTYDGCIKFYRIGSNISVKGNHWKMMSLDYVNGELISCN